MPTRVRPPADGTLPTAEAVMGKAGRENFPVALLALPRDTRRHLAAIYGFARLVDDAGDEAAGDRLVLLDAVEADLDRVYSHSGMPRHPLLRQLATTVSETGLPREPLDRLVEANRQDQRVSRYETFDELAHYCELSANPVGRLVLHVFGRATPERIAWSDSVCTGLQLAEHWQDVGEDSRRGRIYLPLEDLRRFGVPEAHLERRQATAELRAVMAFEVERARALLQPGIPLARSLAGRQRLALAGYVGGGRAALEAVERSGYEVLGDAPRAGRALRVRWIARTVREAT